MDGKLLLYQLAGREKKKEQKRVSDKNVGLQYICYK